jgi:transposase
VVKWANEKLDDLRRRLAGELRAAGRGDEAATLGTGMRALRKDQRKLSPGQRGTLAQIAVVNTPLYKGYLIKEQIREAFKVKGSHGAKLMRGVTAPRSISEMPLIAENGNRLPRVRPARSLVRDGVGRM